MTFWAAYRWQLSLVGKALWNMAAPLSCALVLGWLVVVASIWTTALVMLVIIFVAVGVNAWTMTRDPRRSR